MNKVNLKDGFVLYGYEKYMPDEIIIIYSYTPSPTIRGEFSFMWQATVDGVEYGDYRSASSEDLTPSDKDKKEMFDIVARTAYMTLDELLKETHEKAGIPTT